MGKNIKPSVKSIAFNTVHKKDTIFVFGHGPTGTTTDVIFFPWWTFIKGKPCIAGAIAGLSGFVCSCLFCLWQKGNLFIALGIKIH